MNFTTDLPKRDPLVSYIVASAVKCEKFFPAPLCDTPAFWMHAVILVPSVKQFGDFKVPSDTRGYILCHVWKVSQKKLDYPMAGLSVRTRRAFTEDLTAFQKDNKGKSELDEEVDQICSEM